jgi:hypothetical protein
MRGDVGHRKGRATRSESSEKTQALSPLGRVGGRQQALEMTHIACALLPTRRDPGAIPMGHYHQDLVLTGATISTNLTVHGKDSRFITSGSINAACLSIHVSSLFRRNPMFLQIRYTLH